MHVGKALGAPSVLVRMQPDLGDVVPLKQLLQLLVVSLKRNVACIWMGTLDNTISISTHNVHRVNMTHEPRVIMID